MDEPAVIQIVGYKNRGKTTLVCRLVENLLKKGYRIGTIKHDAHDFEIDVPGKDTWHYREAGAESVAITSKTKTAIIEQRPTPVNDLVNQMQHLDVVLIEGFKLGPFPKIVLIKEETDKLLLDELENVIGGASWIPCSGLNHPVWPIDEIETISNVLQDEIIRQNKPE